VLPESLGKLTGLIKHKKEERRERGTEDGC
jgi:hypothetical protein